MRDFRKYDLWVDAVSLVDDVYLLTNQFPESEKFSLATQVSKSVISISSNIAEGSSRESEKDFARFLTIALGSAFELETQMLIAKRRGFISISEYTLFEDKIQSIQKRLMGLKRKLKNNYN